ncbi:asparagine synthase (glutamine-hydrolyzing) [Halobacillus salinarum]|uniref:asparagine synthase (glutamine-hydrolyzing) n=1 Tax=Halobacillus salinarum TaxID=2932257 RepID=A0ABY4EGQ7_9BACI|nr:asparagine synthase (glutamine-hydrolyzing) [Halobacillus salinarum]UOQ42809.1 asparagine synthase (glutamine-hydrolyzing) [Halobacillus salinarum]
MCGITGWVDWSKNLSKNKETLKAMTDAIEHRGPDAEGFWLKDHAALGHRRLIVIDPEGGAQPMVYQIGEDHIALTYNGELYNYLELRDELLAKGHDIKTNSDTEVLLHAYLEWDTDCIRHFNGIFAFGIWDERQDRLMLGRDHLGVKPLFFAEREGQIIFGSEIKSLLSHPDVEPEVDTEGLAEVFGLGPMRTPGKAVFKGIQEVRAGHFMTFSENNSSDEKYWMLKSKEHTDDVETTVNTIRELLEDTVKRQLIADKPLVTMLSGGLDSSGLTAMAGKEFREDSKALSTYSIDFVNSEADFEEDFLRRDLDEPWVNRVSEHVGTNHTSIVLDSDKLVDHLLVPMRARDLPGVGEIETSLYLLFTEMKKDATVALSGESADEVFSGYPWFHQEEYLDADIFPWLMNLGNMGGILKDDIQEKLQLKQYQKERYQEALEEIPELEGETGMEAKQRRMSYMFITRFLPFMLDRKDRASMMTGFEVRVPFCDYRLVEYLWNIPYEMKRIDDIEKGILRRAFADYLPEDVRYRKKSAYPSTKDDEYLQRVQRWMLNVLDDPDSPILSLIKEDVVREIAEGRHPGIDGSRAKGLLDYLLQINAWLKEYQIRINL